jgi:hypothetical protein
VYNMFQTRFHSRGADDFKSIYRNRKELDAALTNMELVPWTLYDIRCQIIMYGEATTGRVKMNHKQGKIFTRMITSLDEDDLDDSEELQGSRSVRGAVGDAANDDAGPSGTSLERQGQP